MGKSLLRFRAGRSCAKYIVRGDSLRCVCYYVRMHCRLVSVAFRHLSPKDVVALVRQAELNSIEWGGDVHVPPGELGVADEVARLMHDAGLIVASYGSYYRVGTS